MLLLVITLNETGKCRKREEGKRGLRLDLCGLLEDYFLSIQFLGFLFDLLVYPLNLRQRQKVVQC